MRKALRSAGPEDVPFLLDLLERVSGQKWKEAPDYVPSMETLMNRIFFVAVGETMTGSFQGKHASARNNEYAMRKIAKQIRDQF